MALYWRSPYKEIRNGGSHHEAKTSPRSSHSTKSAISRFSEPVSPQDWFDASLAAMKSSPNSLPRRRVSASIKGILKEPQVNVPCEETEVSLLDAAPADDTTNSKKVKKKVTFGVHGQDNGDRNHDFQASRSTSAHQMRLQNREPLDEFARQNLRKLLGYSHIPKPSLPTLAGKALLPSTDTGSPPNSAGSQGRKPPLGTGPGDEDISCLRTPRPSEPVQATPSYLEHARYNVDRKGLDLSVEGVVATPDPAQGNGDEKYRDATDSNEPTKPLKRHWTKSFLAKPADKKRMYRKLAGRYPLSAGTLHRSIPFRKFSHDKTGSNEEMREDFLKLSITGEGSILPSTSADNDNFRHGGAWTHQVSARPETHHNVRGVKVPSTLTHLPDGFNHTSPSNHRYGASANQLRVRYGSQRLEGRDGSLSEQHLDKTAQILSWLQDVKQKEGFQPRNARLYAVELQQQH